MLKGTLCLVRLYGMPTGVTKGGVGVNTSKRLHTRTYPNTHSILTAQIHHVTLFKPLTLFKPETGQRHRPQHTHTQMHTSHRQQILLNQKKIVCWSQPHCTQQTRAYQNTHKPANFSQHSQIHFLMQVYYYFSANFKLLDSSS